MATDTKKNRLSNIFGSKKSQDLPRPEPLHNGVSNNSADSAYASSDPPSQRTSPEQRHSNTYQIENNGQIDGVDKRRNLAVNRQTGDVFDEDSGEVVTTVTTTTTTTTITKGRNGHSDVKVETKPGTTTGGHIAEAPGDSPNSRLHPNNAEQDRLRANAARSPAPQQQPQRTMGDGQPMPPVRNPNRKSREYLPEPNSPSTARHNFSYPSRSQERLRTSNDYPEEPPVPQQQYGSGGGAFQNLKAAAVGLHGVGETLRGTLNNEVDSRLSRRDPDKAAAINAKNRADIERGQREMAKLRERNGLQPTLAQKKSRETYGQQQPSSSTSPYPPEKTTAGMNGGGAYPQPMQQQPPNGVHPAYRGPQPQSSQTFNGNGGRPPPQQQHDYMRDGMPNGGASASGSGMPNTGARMNGGAGAGAAEKPYEYRGPQPDANPVANVQYSSQTQGRAEPEERKGLRGLFGKKK